MPKRGEVRQPGSIDPRSKATVEGNRFGCRWEGAVVLRCQGELDLDSRLALRYALDQVPQSIPVVVDLSDVGFLDCGAVGELVRARNARRAEDGDLYVREPSAHARRVLSIVELDDMVLEVDVDVSDEVHRPAELEALSLVDPLTGLLNRRALDRDLPGALAAARRHRHGLVVVMVGVDGLKAINDGLGHAAGDGVLRGVAESLRAGCRPEDGAYRIGGDEFVLVLHGIGTDDVNGVVDRIRLRRPAPFTWGWAEMGAEGNAIDDVELPARLLELADHRMRRHRVTRDPSDDLLKASRDSTVVEQARGFIAERLGVDLDVSMDTLRSMARRRDEPVASTAARLVDGTIELTTSDPAPARVGEHAPEAAVDRVSGSTPNGG
ncbi:MAG: diguanylate cyclase [Euzebya sp.]